MATIYKLTPVVFWGKIKAFLGFRSISKKKEIELKTYCVEVAKERYSNKFGRMVRKNTDEIILDAEKLYSFLIKRDS